MKVLWLCNLIIPMVSDALGIEGPSVGGWMQGAAEKLINNKNCQLIFVFPQNKKKETIIGRTNLFDYVGFYQNSLNFEKYDSKLEQVFRKIDNDFKPDLIHIWGTEFPHSLAMVNAVTDRNKIIISIQGLCHVIAEHYVTGIPLKVFHRTFRDFIRKDSLLEQKEKFRIRGFNEIESLLKVNNVIGRTNWDKICTYQINSSLNYYKCNELLRDVFYDKAGQWMSDNCEKHSIFVSQADYPIKGFHIFLKAMSILKKEYPDLRVYVTGNDPRKIPRYRISSYHKWIVDLIKEYDLDSNICYLGKLSAEEMCERYLKSEIFVSPSTIENSSNSIGEAMMLGMPIIASYVGGTMDILKDKVDGYLYPVDAFYMLAGYISDFFTNKEREKKFGKNAFIHAIKTHDRDKNNEKLIEIYKTILERGNYENSTYCSERNI